MFLLPCKSRESQFLPSFTKSWASHLNMVSLAPLLPIPPGCHCLCLCVAYIPCVSETVQECNHFFFTSSVIVMMKNLQNETFGNIRIPPSYYMQHLLLPFQKAVLPFRRGKGSLRGGYLICWGWELLLKREERLPRLQARLWWQSGARSRAVQWQSKQNGQGEGRNAETRRETPQSRQESNEHLLVNVCLQAMHKYMRSYTQIHHQTVPCPAAKQKTYHTTDSKIWQLHLTLVCIGRAKPQSIYLLVCDFLSKINAEINFKWALSTCQLINLGFSQYSKHKSS